MFLETVYTQRSGKGIAFGVELEVVVGAEAKNLDSSRSHGRVCKERGTAGLRGARWDALGGRNERYGGLLCACAPGFVRLAAAGPRGALLSQVRGGQVSALWVTASKRRADARAPPPPGLCPSHYTVLPLRGWFRGNVICRAVVTKVADSREGGIPSRICVKKCLS